MTQEITSTGGASANVTRTTKETLEDYTLRFAPRHYRKWSTGVVAISALGGIAYLADFAIGANIGISYGTVNALWGIGVFAVVIFATGFPLAYYAARYNLDLDLITRGSGFGYYGSVVTNVIFATFTFIFFALEARSWPRASNSDSAYRSGSATRCRRSSSSRWSSTGCRCCPSCSCGPPRCGWC
jgi:hypothetical protein